MAFNFLYVECPNCKIKVKVDADKKYQDCPDCKYEFRTEDAKRLSGGEVSAKPAISLADKLKNNLAKPN